MASGTAGNDVLVGTALDDKLLGLAGNDQLQGLDGNDFLDGGLGLDTMVGGRGDDLYLVDSFGDVLIEVAGEGMDEVRTSLTGYVLSANIERLRATGTTGQSLTGNDLSNVITSGGGADTLDGGTGNDTLNGGDGDDLLLSGAGNDYLNGGNGIDVVSFDKAVSGVTVNLSLTRAQATGGAGTDAILNIEDLVGSSSAIP